MKNQYGHIDALCVVDPQAGKNKIRAHFMEMFKLSSITFFESDVNELADMEKLNSKREFILYVTEDIDHMKVIAEIEEYCPQIDTYEKLGTSKYTTVYLLSGNN